MLLVLLLVSLVTLLVRLLVRLPSGAKEAVLELLLLNGLHSWSKEQRR